MQSNTHWFLCVFWDMHCLSATVLAEADLVGLGIQVPQVLIPQHPAVIEGVAVGAVVVTIGRVLPATVVPVLSLVGRKIWTL